MITAVRVIALIASALVMASCGGGDAPADGAAPVFALDRDATAEIADIDPARTDVLSAFQLRLVLQALLTEHATLSNEAMRRALDDSTDASTIEQLTVNTDGLTQAIGLVYGPAGANAFDQLWTNHIEFFNDYAAAIRAGDDELAADVVGSLRHYETDFSDFVSVATDDALDFATVAHVLHSHVEQLLGQADAWHAGDYAAAYELRDEAFRHVDDIATALATGITTQMPDVFPGQVSSESLDRCADTRLAVRLAVTARADVALATAGGPASNAVAARADFEALDTAARGRLDSSSRRALDDVYADIDRAGDVPAARSSALVESDATVSDGRCARHV